jgi:ArsR family transcriptional regulator, arsenate/arsenite/antimonite-responsive transcriptional repressor
MPNPPTSRQLRSRCCTSPADLRLPDEPASLLAQDFQLLADPIRLQILDLLAERGGEVCVCDLEAALPVKQPTVSHHLRLLRQAGLVTATRRGLWAFYTLIGDEVGLRRGRMQSYLLSLGAQQRRARTQEVMDGR